MTNSSTQPWTDLEDEVMLEEEIGEISELIVYNDDVNTFDWVIECLMDVCKHTLEQAEQLSMLVHFKGKAIVKTGVLDILRPMKDALCERGLSAVIETIKV
ncbi:MAG: ATP-dependent Clp protease adaptor ClpS [Saprospiraceae bacterium]|jgi:ATP-dependent Clp protease adaptor protein ClpS|uniref:ATP-dependent Clp protease adaptor ClpS n=1 Tax=Candidatus Defluviibacterium haderslevense TaxID=2981993 RepID=A0A9D7S724_9BACT|nr:ATP-dependent Clp protease adaptor ClpS [Candidatus Defluviibacterium haderslevense]MCC7027000.1 ATP-dependent Clp protease adaptor ClpS [Saprospiraceae bacterium]MBK7242527.1 ATP-dependent Clp protease adaptor ClpS [Candidatus Defluviibacterium haderslevense]MBK8242522.1 ATP-dependent Clp protease adaptor ClpS [Candidatus Defluviibacterium haderslevense]MBK9716883.1 ATP-dependent Clp protease adaptor ClpS [Candidatus Defluviibacterium haderslevense]